MISILIRNKNEQDFIGFSIQSCIDHFDNPEIIILDNDSTDESLEIVKMFPFSDITIKDIDAYSPGKALNYGTKYAINKHILMLSAHAQIIDMDYEFIKQELNEHKAVFGMQIPIYKGKKINKRYVWSHFVDEQKIVNMYSKLEQRNFLHNAFCFYDRDYLIENPFNEKLMGKEERYWATDMIKRGDSYLYTNKMKCNHYWTGAGATFRGVG